MPNPFPVIINAAAGQGHSAADAQKLQDLFRTAGAEARVLAARSGGELRTITEREARAKPAVIAAGGGDGTISTVASVLVGTDIALGILPMGTLNHFAKDAHIPLDLGEATCNIVARHVVHVDVGEVNDRIFLNNSSVGLYPSMVLHRRKLQQRLGRGKWHAMFWATMTVLRRSPFLNVKLFLDGKDQECRTPFIFIGNNEYQMEGFDIGRREHLDAGRLSVYVTRRGERRGLLRLVLRALFGLLSQTTDFEAAIAHSVRLETRHKRVLVATDGEVTAMETPLHYRSRSGALRVIVPGPGTTSSS